MCTPPEHKPLEDSAPVEFLAPGSFPAGTELGETSRENLAERISETLLEHLPNDLTRMIYLASLRDCNSGLYLHPELSQQEGVHAADRALCLCHEQVFRRLVTTRLPEYVRQLQEYIRYTRGEADTMLKTWKSLQAYRATVPVGAAAVSTELFFLNIGVALEALTRQLPS